MTRKLLEVNYNLHGIVTIHISTIYRNILDFYNLSFRHFKSEEKTGPQKYFIRDYACFQLPPCFFYMDKECIGFDTGFCLPHEHYAVEVNDEGITEYTDAECKSPHLWVQYLLLRQNMCMIHGAALELNGRGIIFPSVSGGGKTTLVAHLRNLNGFRFFTDEFVIIDSDGTMFSYPQYFTNF